MPEGAMFSVLWDVADLKMTWLPSGEATRQISDVFCFLLTKMYQIDLLENDVLKLKSTSEVS